MATRNQPVQNAENQDTRLQILNTLLTTPHRDLMSIYPIHQQMIAQDPLFYRQLAVWYNDTGDVRDHKEMFIVNLALSSFEGHRDVGMAMLRELPPYQVYRCVNFISGEKENKKVFKKVGKKTEVETKVESFGLFKNVPRTMYTEVERYLREREADNEWFDSCVVMARKAMRRLYALGHIKPSERAKKILFEKEPPEDSKSFAIKQLANAATPADQAKAIVEYKIPYRIASSVVSAMTPTVLLALIEVMSSQELINNLGMLKKRGVLDNPELKAVVEKKLDTAKTAKRVAALKPSEAMKAVAVDDSIQKKLEAVADTQIKARGRIKRPTALLIDKSASMNLAIDLGKQIGSVISAVMDAPLYVYTFDTMPYPITAKGTDLASWEKALKGVIAANGTSCGCGVQALQHFKQFVEQIIIITDEGENEAPVFWDAVDSYQKAMNTEVNVMIVKCKDNRGNWDDKLEVQAKQRNKQVSVWKFEGDYYSIGNLIPLLARPSKLELLMDIMNWPMPERKAA